MKRKKSNAAQTSPSLVERWQQMPVNQQRRLMIKSACALGIALVGGVALSAYDNENRELHDLSVIGEGRPVVVQVHDTSCPTCRRLKSLVQTAITGMDGIDYRLADIATADGKALQDKYNAQKITLLLFDARGRHVDTLVGLRTVEQLQAAFEGLAGGAAAS